MKKVLLGLFSILIIFIAYEVFPTYSTVTPKTVISTTVTTTEISGENAIITVHRYDTFQYYQHLVSFSASCKINGIQVLKAITDEYPLDKLKNPLSSASSGEICSIPEEWKYLWDAISFVKAPGPPEIYVKYDHPNNLPPPDGEYRPGEVNIDYELQGTVDYTTILHNGELRKIFNMGL